MSSTQGLYYHLGGVPAVSGLPLTLPRMKGGKKAGRYYFVDGNAGVDGNEGTDWTKPLKTIERAITLVNAEINWSASPWAPHAVIVIAPGTYAENLTSLPYGATMYGVGDDLRDAQNGVKIKPASGDPIDVSACINASFYNIGFEAVDNVAAFDASICNNVYFQNCFFTGPAETATIPYAFYTNDCTKTTFRHCWFANADHGVSFNYADGGDGINYLLMEDCIISGCDTAGIYVSTNLVGPHSIVRRTDIFGGGQTLAKGVDDNSGILELSGCNITATDPVEGCRSANGCYGNGGLLNGSGE